MTKPACQMVLWRLVILVVLLGVPASGSVFARQSSGEFDIDVQVVPGSGPASGDATEGGEAGSTSPNGAGSSRSTAAELLEVGLLPSAGVNRVATFDVFVTDQRHTGRGWIVKVMQAPDEPAPPLVLTRYLHATRALDGQDVQDGSSGPRGYGPSVGQPLDRMTPVIVAQPGAGAGTYSIRFAVSGPVADPGTSIPLIVSITTAP